MNATGKEQARATVLIADDNEDHRQTLAAILAGEGYEVIEAANGVEALELLALAADGKRRRPDVLLLDFCMPGLSGIGLLRVLRRFARVPPSILVTAFPDKSVETFARNAGAMRVLRKPLNAQEICQSATEALSTA